MSRKRSIRERMAEMADSRRNPKKPTPPSIFEAAQLIGKFSGQRIDLLSANIQNEFGVCGWILTILSYLLIFFTLPISACMCIKVVQEYERAVIFRLGRLMPGGAKGPGIFFIVPCIDTYRKVDLRVLSFEVPPQEILSKDSVTVAVDAVVYFRISNATISVTNVEDAARSTKLLAQTTLRNILGTKTLAEMLSDREAISHQMQTTLDEATEPWGVKVERVEVKDVRLPVQLQRAMAAEAEAAREARAKVIVAEGEQKASRALKEAAEVIAESPSALQLRYLQTLNSISAEKNSTIIFPFPIDLLSAFLQRTPPKVEEPPSLPKKIRSCCLYKYPDWVQGMVGSEGGGGHGHSHGGGGGGLGSSQVRAKGSIPSISSRFRPEHHNHQWPSAAPQHARSAVSLRSTADLSSKSVPNISESVGPRFTVWSTIASKQQTGRCRG
ncbi:Band 7 domain-containing protein [Caenorhabditis elegans]|uniref:Band 7 domain-containing protein n=1 Tax=Caenorhabditis elegans TaxID=6239 RepID=A0A3B1E8U1_CAEEL|nr:Band 7 domain-containing protein [Caenorhabditis elegans]VAY52586.1 Band 7 domain-containing protein [Caenorhabditis elegans]|eukprot:NP_001355459.1 Mechanosensory protein 2 [Caenorhabditis elegans]